MVQRHDERGPAHPNSRRRDAVPTGGRKTYTAPALLEYGSIRSLTQGMNGSRFDPGHMLPLKLGGGGGPEG